MVWCMCVCGDTWNLAPHLAKPDLLTTPPLEHISDRSSSGTSHWQQHLSSSDLHVALIIIMMNRVVLGVIAAVALFTICKSIYISQTLISSSIEAFLFYCELRHTSSKTPARSCSFRHHDIITVHHYMWNNKWTCMPCGFIICKYNLIYAHSSFWATDRPITIQYSQEYSCNSWSLIGFVFFLYWSRAGVSHSLMGVRWGVKCDEAQYRRSVVYFSAGVQTFVLLLISTDREHKHTLWP